MRQKFIDRFSSCLCTIALVGGAWAPVSSAQDQEEAQDQDNRADAAQPLQTERATDEALPLESADSEAGVADTPTDTGERPVAETGATILDRGSRWSVSYDAGAAYQFEADYGSEAGDASVLFAGGGLDVSYALDRQTRFSFGFEYMGAEWDFDDASGLSDELDAGDEPFGTLHSAGVSAGFARFTQSDWLFFGNVGVRSAFEAGADFEDSVTFSGVLGAGYRYNDNLSIGFGVAASTVMEDSELVLPILGFDWRISERWRLGSSGVLSRAADRSPLSRGTSIELSYQATDEARLYLRSSFLSDDYRLDEDNEFNPGGVFRNTRINLTAGIDWEPSPAVAVRAFAGASLYQEIEFDNDGGREIADGEADPAPVVGLIAVFRY